ALSAGDALLADGALARVGCREGALADATGDVAALAGRAARFAAAHAVDAREARLAGGGAGPAGLAELEEAALPVVLPAPLRADAAPVLGAELALGGAVARAAPLQARDVCLADGAGLARGVVAAE